MPASSTDETDDDERREPEPATCWERFIAEQNPCQDWFLKQHPANDRPVDISASFAPEGCQPLFFKVICTAFVMATAIWSFIEFDEPRGFWLAFSTNWVLSLGSVYMLCSLLMTLFGAPQPYKRVSSWFVKFTWLLFTYVSHFGFLNSIYWWLYIWEKGVTPMDWLNLVPHAILPFTVFFDGTNVNRIPLRWQHYWGFALPMECAYVLWTYLQNEVFEVENPELLKNDTDLVTTVVNITDEVTNITQVVTNVTEVEVVPNVTSHYIYEDFNWKEEGTEPLIISAIGIFAFGPPIFLIQWLFAQYLVICLCLWDRRFYYTDPRANRPKRRYVQGAGLAMSSARQNSFDEDDDDSYNSGFDSQEESDEEESSSEPQEESSNRESSNREDEEESYSQEGDEESYSEQQEEEKVEDEPMDRQPKKKYRSKLEELAYDA